MRLHVCFCFCARAHTSFSHPRTSVIFENLHSFLAGPVHRHKTCSKEIQDLYISFIRPPPSSPLSPSCALCPSLSLSHTLALSLSLSLSVTLPSRPPLLLDSALARDTSEQIHHVGYLRGNKKTRARRGGGCGQVVWCGGKILGF